MTLPPLPTSEILDSNIFCPWCRHDNAEDIHIFDAMNMPFECVSCHKQFEIAVPDDEPAHWIGVRSEADEKYLAWEEGI